MIMRILNIITVSIIALVLGFGSALPSAQAQEDTTLTIGVDFPLAQNGATLAYTITTPPSTRDTLEITLPDTFQLQAIPADARIDGNTLLIPNNGNDTRFTFTAIATGAVGETIPVSVSLQGQTATTTTTILPNQLPQTGLRENPSAQLLYGILITMTLLIMIGMGLRTRQRQQRDFYRRRLIR